MARRPSSRDAPAVSSLRPMQTETETSAADGAAAAARVTAGPAGALADDFIPEHHVYEPHKVGLPPLRPYLRELWRRREFARELSRTRLAAQHFNTVFGKLWMILNPLLLSGVYFILIDILRRGHRPEGFFAHLLSCIFAYYLVSDSLRMASKSVTSGGRLILNTAFPRTLLPLSAVLTSATRFVPAIFVYAVVHALSGLPWNLNMLWSIVVFFELVVLASGLAMLVAAGQVYFRDLANFLPYMLRMWLYISPVLWLAENVPHGYKVLLYVNPLGGPLAAWNESLNETIRPGGTWLLLGAAWALAAFVVGAVFFVSRERDFAVRI